MKKIILFIVLTMTLFYASALLGGSSKANGITWKGYHEYAKLGFTLGFLVGANKAIEELAPYIRQSTYRGERVETLVPIYNITNTQLKVRLDNFYSHEENITIPIEDAIILICKEMIPKKDTAMIRREKEILRLPPPKQKVERIKDHIKKEIREGKYPQYAVREEKIVKRNTKEVVPLKSEEEVTDFWFRLLVPRGGTKVREVVKMNYSIAVIVALIAAGVIILLLRRRGGQKK